MNDLQINKLRVNVLDNRSLMICKSLVAFTNEKINFLFYFACCVMCFLENLNFCG